MSNHLDRPCYSPEAILARAIQKGADCDDDEALDMATDAVREIKAQGYTIAPAPPVYDGSPKDDLELVDRLVKATTAYERADYHDRASVAQETFNDAYRPMLARLAQVRSLSASLEATRKALEKYGCHVHAPGPMCESSKHSDYPCTCGLDSILAATPKKGESPEAQNG